MIRHGKAASRAGLVQLTGLSPSTVTARIEQLLQAGYLSQGSNDRGGRNPRALTLDPSLGYVAVADIGARHIRLGLVDVTGAILASRLHEQSTTDFDKFIQWLETAFRDFLADFQDPIGPRPLLGIGLSIPAPVDAQTGRVVYPARVPTWHDADLIGPLSDAFSVPVATDNDATLMALAEHRIHHPGVENMLFVKIGSGVGCGIIARGEVYRGSNGGAGDIGHVSVDVSFAHDCLCGRDHCLEASVGGSALVRILRQRGVGVTGPADVERLARENQADALELSRTAGRAIGEALALIANFFNPELIVVGGALSQIEPLYNSMRSSLYERMLALTTHKLVIELSKNGVDASLYGPAFLILDQLLSPDRVSDLLASI
jgi:predicted NBD/HSP70 family sugar kinase